MKASEIQKLEQVVREHRDEFERKWHEYFG